MKLDCKLEASGIEEIVLFRKLKYVARSDVDGKRFWEKFVIVIGGLSGIKVTYEFITDHTMMKKVKELALRKNIHVWVSGETLNIDWRRVE